MNAVVFGDLLEWSGARHVFGRKGTRLSGFSIDSRTLKAGEAFFALKGPRFDGHHFALSAVRAGCPALILERTLDQADMDFLSRCGIAVGLVKDSLAALQSVASRYRRRFEIPIIAITGSCGKTSTKDFVHAFLEFLGPSLKNEGTLNNHIGVPLTLLNLRPNHRTCCLEMGTSGPGEIRLLAEIARPTAAVVLNVGPAHLKLLRNLEGVLCEKWSLAEIVDDGPCVYNEDDPLLRRAAADRPRGLFSFGIYHGGRVRASRIEFLENRFTRFILSFDGQELGVVRVPFIGLHHVYNILAAMSASHLEGVPWPIMIEQADDLRLPPLRWESREINGVTMINDAYNANPESLKAALEAFSAVRTGGKKILICADMADLGTEERRWHAAAAQYVEQFQVDVLIGVGPLAAVIVQTLRDMGNTRTQVFSCENRREGLQILKEVVQPGDAVLVKGSRVTEMDKIVDEFAVLSREAD